MPTRKAKAYSKKHITAFTRKSQRVKHLNYIKAVPLQKISKFNMGSPARHEKGEFKNSMVISSEISCQIRDLALEAARQYLNNQITKKMQNNYYIACKPYPHQVIRNNKIFSGGSKGERIQSGMSHAFGTTEGRAASIKAGEKIFILEYPNKNDTSFIREICKSASAKLPCKTKIIYQEIK